MHDAFEAGLDANDVELLPRAESGVVEFVVELGSEYGYVDSVVSVDCVTVEIVIGADDLTGPPVGCAYPSL